MTSAFDSQLFKNVFGTPDMRKIFGDTGYLERVVATETGPGPGAGSGGAHSLRCCCRHYRSS
jgi:hypothetical protein